MKIKRIEIKNNPILWDININFVKKNGEIANTILMIWENGSWKTTLLNIIYNMTNLWVDNPSLSENETRKFFIYDEIYDKNYAIILDNTRNNNFLILNRYKNIYAIVDDNNNNNDDNLISSYEQHIFVEEEWIYNEKLTHDLIFPNDNPKFTVFSNFITPEINDLWTKENKLLISDFSYGIEWTSKTNADLNENIKTLLIALCSADGDEMINFVKNNPDRIPPKEIIDKRVNIFRNAINLLFEDSNLEFVWLDNLKPIFKKNSALIDIEQLSLWEKEIILKWWFLLFNSITWNQKITLIDEPENWLHPRRQRKILLYYKTMLLGFLWEQKSQIIITTHSPFILQWSYDDFDLILSFPRWESIDNLRSYIWEKPSFSIINYTVYGIPSVDLHDELYGYIQTKTWCSELKTIEDFFKENWLKKTKPRVQEIYNSWVLVKSVPWNDCSLQSFIRNKAHHPENEQMQWSNYSRIELKESIDEMIELINRLSL